MIRPAGAQDGFTLLETVCVVAIIAMLAAILLPILPRATSRPRLEAYAIETASLLNGDRTAAIRRRTAISTQVDANTRSIRSGSSGRVVQIPNDVSIDALLPQRCNDAPAFHTISFFATGMSCGGSIAFSRLGAGYEVRVNWLTGGIEIVPRRVL
jgi:general secretion pathway protein H